MAKAIEVVIVGDATQLQAALGKASAQVEGFAGKMTAAGTKMSALGKTLTRHLTLPIVAAGAVSVKFAVDFQHSMELVHTQAGATQKEVESMSKAVLALAPTVGTGPDELAKGLYHVESVGLRGAAALNVLKEAAFGAKVGNANLEDTTNALSAAWVSGIKGASNMRMAMGTLNAIVGVGNMRMGDLAASMSSGILPAAKTFGISLRSVGAALATMTDAGVPAQDAATRLRMTFSLLGAPTSKAQTLLKSIGINSLQMANAMRQPGGIINAIQLLKTHLDGMSKSSQAALLSGAFGGGRSSSTILTLIGNLDRLKTKYDAIGQGIGKYGAAVKATTETSQFKFQQALAQLQVTGIQIGASLLPILVKLAEAIASVAKAFSGLSGGMQEVVVGAAIAVAALGPLLSVIGNLAKVGGFLGKSFGMLAPSLGRTAPVAEEATNGLVGFGAAAEGATGASSGLAAGLLGPAGIVAGGLLAIGVFIKVTHGLEGQSHAMDDATAAAQNYATALQGIKPAQLSLKEATAAHVQAIKAYHTAQQKVNQDVKDGIKGTQQYRDDLVAQQQAHFNVTGTLLAQQTAQGQLNDKQQQARADAKRTANGLEELSRDAQKAARSQNDLNNRFGGFIEQAGGAKTKLKLIADQAAAFSGKTLTLATNQEKLAKKLGGTGTSAGIAETKIAAMSLGASILTDRIGHVPTSKRILIYYQNHMQTLIDQALQLGAAIDHLQSKSLSVNVAFNTYHTHSGPSSGNAAGTDYWRGGSTWVGERGPEIVNLPRGSQVIPHGRSMAMAGHGGGGGGIHLHFPHALVVDGASVRAAAKMLAPELNRMKARSA